MVSWTKKLKSKKVLINIRQLQEPYSGVQSYIYNLVKSVVGSSPQTEFQLLTLNYQGKNSFVKDLLTHSNTKLVNHTGVSFPFSQVIFDLLTVNKYISGVDLYFNPVNMTPYFRDPRIPHLVGVLDLCTFIVPQTTTITLKTYYDLFLESSLNRTDLIITISKNTRSDLIKLFSIKTKKIKVIHLGLDPQFTQSSRSAPLTLLTRFKLKPQHYFISLGTSPRKNISTTIAAFALHHHRYPTTKFFIVSSSPQMFNIISQSINRYQLPTSSVVVSRRFLSVSQLKLLYTQSLGMVYCPWYEGFGLPILEAMYARTPVITTKNSSLSEIAGTAALFAKPDSPTSIALQMQKLYQDPGLRKSLIKAGLKNSHQYSWSQTASQVLEIFSSYFK